jgi:hypothetical protein
MFFADRVYVLRGAGQAAGFRDSYNQAGRALFLGIAALDNEFHDFFSISRLDGLAGHAVRPAAALPPAAQVYHVCTGLVNVLM